MPRAFAMATAWARLVAPALDGEPELRAGHREQAQIRLGELARNASAPGHLLPRRGAAANRR